MEPQPLADVLHSRRWQRTVGALLVGVAFAFHTAVPEMVRVWMNQADYSHGFFVPLVAGYILYQRRKMLPPLIEWPAVAGLVPLVLGVAVSMVGSRYNYAIEFAHGIGLILALTGVVLLALGMGGLKWAWPGLAFLVFMVKMPDRIEILFTFKLRQIATQASNFILQTLGYPSYVAGQGGTVITVGDVKLGVEWACSGLSMVLTFVAVGTAVALLMTKRESLDRWVVFMSAIPIAIVSNIIRITLTSLVYIAGWKWLGDKIVHDLAGWLMMPLALAFMWVELRLLDWLFVMPPVADRDTVLKSATMAAAANWVVPERTADDEPDEERKLRPPVPESKGSGS